MKQPNPHQISILIVDDTPENLTILTRMLIEQGYLVHSAINGEVALKAVQKILPDLILLDIMMPGMDGYEICRQLKADEKTRDIPVIFMSALDETMDKVKAFEVGGVDYVTPPFQTEEVLARIETHLALWNSQKHLQEKNVQFQQEINDHRQTEEALQQRNQRLLLINQVGQMFSSSLELEHVLETALGEIQRLLDAFATSFWLIAPETNELVCMHAKGPGSKNLVYWRLAPGQGVSGWAVKHNESLLISDTWADERHFRNVDEQTGVTVRSMISIPLRVKGKVIGVLNLVDPRVGHFTHNDLIFLEPVAAAAAIAIENARLYTAAQQEITERKRAEEALKESMELIERAKEEWESTADSLSYVVCLLDDQGSIIRANRTVEYWNLGRVVDVKGRGMHELFHPDCPEPTCYLNTFLAHAWEEVTQGISIGCEARDNILQRYLSIQIRPISAQLDRQYKSSASFAVGVVSDITERKWAEEMLQQRNHELALLNQMSDLLYECRTEKETYTVVANVCEHLFPANSGFLCMMDASRTRLEVGVSWGSPPIGLSVFGVDDCWALRRGKIHLVEHPNTESLCPHLRNFPENGYLCAPINAQDEILGILSLYFGQSDPYHSDDKYKRMLESKWMVISRVVEHYALSLANLRLRETLRMESIHDPLTGLYNRRYMETSLERETSRARRNNSPVGLIMLDIDHFKIFNDTHGHEAGDVVLQELGALLRSNLRGGDIACRYGGEEFLLILPDATLEATQKRAEELLSRIRELQITYQDMTFHITISAGVAALLNHGLDVQNTVNAADTALYQAKQTGRNQVVVASS